VLREVIRQLKGTTSVAITAPTGIAGLNIGGSTIHSFAGIGLGKEAADRLASKIKHSKRLYERWTTTKVLVIDEGQPSFFELKGMGVDCLSTNSIHDGRNSVRQTCK